MEPAELRSLPSVERLAASLGGPHELAVIAARSAIARTRAGLAAGSEGGARDVLGLAVAELERLRRPSLRRVLNATGVIVHTNLGRAPLAADAAAAVAEAACGYGNLELELVRGERGSRQDHVRDLLCELTGAQDALAVNNCAAVVLLAAASLAGDGRELVVSRGQLVEIGGSFRIPDVVAASGAQLVEVGTTNRTRLEDYAGALGERTGAILRAHPSNFRVLGFTEEVEIEALCGLGAPVIDDVGSGALAQGLPALAEEPAVVRSVVAGAALTCFSGDKLLGGPQAGLMVGERGAVARARAHPLARAVRIDKLSLAALEATLRLYREPARARREIPVLRMLEEPGPALERRAAALFDRLRSLGVDAEVVASVARVGGGALPLLELEGPAVAVDADSVERVAHRLRTGEPAVLCRLRRGRLLLEVRTLDDAGIYEVAGAVARALGGGGDG